MLPRIALALALVLCSASLASAQYEPTFVGCPGCGVVYGYVDTPATSLTLSNTDLLNHTTAPMGWGFACYTGSPIDRVDLYVEDDARPGFWNPVPSTDPNASTTQTWSGYVARPDVEAAFAAACPNVRGVNTGFIRWIDKALPLGAHRFLFVLWKGPYHTPTQGTGAIIKTLNIVP
jgi:hypothetical protein